MILAVNLGSASKKYALYKNEEQVYSAHFEKSGTSDGGFTMSFIVKGKEDGYPVQEIDYHNSLSYVLKSLVENKIIENEEDISETGIRIVAPGEYFTAHKLIDSEYMKHLESAGYIAPLHLKPVMEEIKKIKFLLPKTALVGVSDSAFHADMPEAGKRYALPEDISSRYGIYRYGYHGLSLSSAVSKMKKFPGGLPKRAVVCHLGSGASITALLNGKSIDTSMGFSPLEGLPMGSRVGNIDAEAVLYLLSVMKMKPDKMSQYLNSEAGLSGLSGGQSDIRELLESEKKGELEAKFALEFFVYKIKQYIGAYTAVLGGLDALIFTGTAGERSFMIRSRVCEGLGELGIHLDDFENKQCAGEKDSQISSAGSPAIVSVIVSREMDEIANSVMNVDY